VVATARSRQGYRSFEKSSAEIGGGFAVGHLSDAEKPHNRDKLKASRKGYKQGLATNHKREKPMVHYDTIPSGLSGKEPSPWKVEGNTRATKGRMTL